VHPALPPRLSKTASAMAREDTVLEVAMEGLSAEVCAVYHGSDPAHAGKNGKALALSMSELGGVAGLVRGADVDDWAFEPCGYSMNAQRGLHYYTVHVTPERAFSYASFETTDPAYVSTAALAKIVDAFQPTRFTVTLTTRTPRSSSSSSSASASAQTLLPDAFLAGYHAAVVDLAPLSHQVSVACRTYVRVPPKSLADDDAVPTAAPVGAADGGCEDSALDSASSVVSLADPSEVDSESTAPLDETLSTSSDVEGDKACDKGPSGDSPERTAKRAKASFVAKASCA